MNEKSSCPVLRGRDGVNTILLLDQHGIVLAAHHERKASQIGDDGTRPILSIQTEQGARLWELVRSKLAPDCRARAMQFLPVEPSASIAERAEPLVGVSLRDGGSGTDDFPPFAPSVARGTDLIQPAQGRRQIRVLGQGPLAGGLSRAIDIKDESGLSLSIHKLASLPLWAQRAREQIVEKERAQGFDGLWGERRQKA